MRAFFAIISAALCCTPLCAEVTFLGTYHWTSSDPNFGGFSGIELDSSGTNFAALSDRGRIISGALVRDDVNVIGVEAGPLIRLQNLDGIPVFDDASDAEGLALGHDGMTFVSFEGVTRVWSYKDTDGQPDHIFNHTDFRLFQANASLEALAIDASGTLFTVPERSGRANRPFQVYRNANETWEKAFLIARRGPFLVAGADFGPDGKLYILERDFTGIGFRSRIRRFDPDGQNEMTLLTTHNATHDNLEGISVWQDDVGIRITMISDDNFRFFQKTEIVEYRITD